MDVNTHQVVTAVVVGLVVGLMGMMTTGTKGRASAREWMIAVVGVAAAFIGTGLALALPAVTRFLGTGLTRLSAFTVPSTSTTTEFSPYR
jgi:hypothetical protein